MQKHTVQQTILVFIFFGVVLAFNPWFTTEIFEWPKLIILLVGVGIFSLVNIAAWIRRDDTGQTLSWRSCISLEMVFLVLFAIGNCVAFIFSTDRATSLLGSPVRFQGFITQLFYALFGLNTYYFLSRPGLPFTQVSRSLFRWLIMLLVIVSTLALTPYAFPTTFSFFAPALFFNRVYSTLGNPNYLASVMVALLPFLVLTGKQVATNKYQRLLVWPAVALVMVTLFLTGSRGAWLVTLTGFLLFGLVQAIERKQFKLLFLTIGVGVLLATGFLIKNRLTPIAPQFNRLALDTPESSSIASRFNLWRTGLAMIRARPLTGFGQDMVAVNVEPYLPAYLRKNNIFYIDRLHNEFIDIVVMNGFIAFVGYVGLLGTVWIRAAAMYWRKEESKRSSDSTLFLGTALLSVTILTLFHTLNFSTISSNVLLVFLMAYLSALNKHEADDKRSVSLTKASKHAINTSSLNT